MVLHRSESTERVLQSFAALDRRNDASVARDADRRPSLERLVSEATDTAWHEYVRRFVVRHDRLSGDEPKERLVSKLMAEPLFSLPSPCRRHRNRKDRDAASVDSTAKSKWPSKAGGAPVRRRYLQSPPKALARNRRSWSTAAAPKGCQPYVAATRDALDVLMTDSCTGGADSIHSSVTASTDSSADSDSQERRLEVRALETDTGDALDAFVYAWHSKKILSMFKR